MPTSSPRTALLGHTGFVGSNLLRQRPFTACFNSRNIAELAGQSFDTLVCAGVQAVKWLANKEPEADWAGIQRLLEPLSHARAERVILISTIDVYPNPNDVNEADFPSSDNHAYGRHRLAVEDFVKAHFPKVHIVRLPGLFGPGLKKNVIYDLLHDHCLDAVQPDSAFQYYDLQRLTDDLDQVVAADIPLLNVATGPISTRTIIERLAPEQQMPKSTAPIAKYDFRSAYAGLWNGSGGYLYSAEQVLADLELFMTTERARPSGV